MATGISYTRQHLAKLAYIIVKIESIKEIRKNRNHNQEM
jgi:hypothetical protein